MIRTLIIISALSLSACATTQTMQEPIVRVETEIVSPPEALLTCKGAPARPQAPVTNAQIAEYIERLENAGEDCRDTVRDLRAWVRANE